MTRPIVIAGAGIGGLTAGIALRQHGFTVRVLERAAALDPVGAGITVQVNAMRVMQRLGIADAITAAGATVESGAIRRADGRVLRAMNQLDLVREYGAPFVAIHRARLQDVLLTAFGAEHLVTGIAVTEVTTGADGATVKLADGTSHDAAIVVGADGLRSTVRAALFGPEPLRAAEQIAWRGICPRSAAAGDPGGESWGRSARFGFVAINDREVYWYAAIDSAVSPPEHADQHAAMMDFYRGWHAPIPDLLRTTDPARVIRTELFDRVPIDTWGRGAVTLLGDAAHPMTPNLGQGGCQAIEDAWVLARELARDPSPEGLRRYETARRARTKRFVEESWRFGRLAQSSNPVVMGLRNLALRLVPDSLTQKSLAWSFDFDPDA
jgi:2-polyprenyl-6-methoxyphenol hydroxylase-like FAD-dependent oxidoreductase